MGNSVFLQTQCRKIIHCKCKINEILDKNRKWSESGMVKQNKTKNYLKNKQENVKHSNEKFPNFMANAMDLGVINDDKQQNQEEDTKNIEQSLVPSSATPSLVP